MKKIHVLLLLFLSLSFGAMAQQCANKLLRSGSRSATDNLRSDTTDVLNYKITLNITDFTGNTISGNCEVKFVPKMNNINSICLDLLAMNIDSVTMNGSQLAYNYNDTLLTAIFSVALNIGDTNTVIVYYNGAPQMDPSGWGGFYFQSGYAYNLGVGFQSLPHNFGRVWHPCFDNFAEHATYDFIITSNNGKRAYCNGYLVGEQVSGSDITRTWRMDHPIPSYLAMVAVASYTHVEQQYISPVTGDTIPVWLTAVPTDTTNVKNSFLHLFDAMQAFEQGYGPYEWNKVGYSMVPFSQGAMEHATNITYPRLFANGLLIYEELMAHELSHHWWGDLVTCMTAEEMWINEGMAVYSERLFREFVYGQSAYFSDVRANHKNVIWKAHINDGGIYAIANVPQNVTYGEHSYNKGADVAHCLRGYLGDSLFFLGLQTIIANNKFKNITSVDFRDQLNAIPGINVTDFFDGWVLNPGFPEFSIDSFLTVPNGGNFDVTVYVHQRLRHAPAYFNSVPLQVVFRDANNNMEERTITANGQTSSATFTIPINPVYAALNENEKISDAVTGDNLLITSTGLKNFSHGNYQVTLSALTDTTFVRAEQHWVAPDGFKTPNPAIVISTDRYWIFHGVGIENMTGTARINYNGGTGGSGHLDSALMVNHGSVVFHEDSIALLHRLNAADDWKVFPKFTLQTQASKTDKVGALIIDSIAAGEYTLGMIIAPLSINKIIENEKISIYPNPTDGMITVDMSKLKSGNYSIEIYDMQGKQVQRHKAVNNKSEIPLHTNQKGTYIVLVNDKKRTIASERVVVR